MSVYAQTNSADFYQGRQAAEEYISGLSARASKVAHVTFKKSALGSAPAEMASADFECAGSREQYASLLMTALNHDKQFVYTIAWEGKASGKQAALDIIAKMGQSWRLTVPK